mgnify:CR=1 FL=1
MPDKKMDKKRLAVYRKLILKMRENILHDIKNMTVTESGSAKDSSVDVSSHALHMADVATDMYDREFNLGLASNDRELLSRLKDALQRIQEKTYGRCTDCKKSIPVARLKAIPYTEYFLKCQEKLEKGGGRKG